MVAIRSTTLLHPFLIITIWAILALTVGCGSSKVPSSYTLENPYPNPFSPQTMIEYTVEDSCFVTLNLWDAKGVLIGTLVNEMQKRGHYKVDLTKIAQWSEMVNGVYFYKLEICGKSATKKLVVQK